MRLTIEHNTVHAGRATRETIDPNHVAAVLTAQGRHPIIARILAFGGTLNTLEAQRFGEDLGLIEKGAAIMTTSSDAKRIQFNRADKDYSAYYDGEYIGTFATYHQAEIELDAHALDLLERGLVDTVEGITTMQWQARTLADVAADLTWRSLATDSADSDPWNDGPSQAEQAAEAALWTACEGGWEQFTPDPFDPSKTVRLFQPRIVTHARVAEEPELLFVADPTPVPDPNDTPPPGGPGEAPGNPSDGRAEAGEIEIPYHKDYGKNRDRTGNGEYPPCVVCGRGIKASNPAMVHVHHGGTHLVTEERAAQLDPAADMYCFPIGPCCLKKHPELKPFVLSALTGAPGADTIEITSDAPTLPSASQDGAADATQPAASDLTRTCAYCTLPIAEFIGGVPCCSWHVDIERDRQSAPADPRATLTALLKAALEEWQECGLPTPYDVALAQLARLISPPSGYFLSCGVCGGPHIGWQCPRVAAEKARQIEQAKWGETICYLLRHHRDVLIGSMQTAPLVEERAEALALYLTHATGIQLGVAMVERHLAQLAQQNAASA